MKPEQFAKAEARQADLLASITINMPFLERRVPEGGRGWQARPLRSRD